MRKILIAFIAAASIGAMSARNIKQSRSVVGLVGPGAVVGAFVAVLSSEAQSRHGRTTRLLTTTDRTLLRTTLP